LGKPDNSLLVAAEGDNILAVGSVTDAGQITLNYVSPDARFRGVSRALLGALEARARERGNTLCTLTQGARHVSRVAKGRHHSITLSAVASALLAISIP
jgi:GNAT superfamily N-acetyltransferase